MSKRSWNKKKLPFLFTVFTTYCIIFISLLISSVCILDGILSENFIYSISPLLCIPGVLVGTILAKQSEKRKLALLLIWLLPTFALIAISEGKLGTKYLFTLFVYLLPILLGMKSELKGKRKRLYKS